MFKVRSGVDRPRSVRPCRDSVAPAKGRAHGTYVGLSAQWKSRKPLPKRFQRRMHAEELTSLDDTPDNGDDTPELENKSDEPYSWLSTSL